MAVTLTMAIFIVSYLFIISGKINQALVAVAGGVFLLLTNIYTWESAFTLYIDWSTITLLFAMMVLVSITKKTGLFTYIAIRFAQQVKGAPIPLLIGTAIMTAVGSALLDNVTTVLLFVPIIITITKLLQLPSFPYLLTMIFSSNIGGASTLIGDPPNIMIGQAVEHLTFSSFILNMAPVSLILFCLMLTFILLRFKSSFKENKHLIEELLKIDANSYLEKTPMLYQSITVLSLTIVGFLLHPFLHLDLTTVAVCGALLLLLLTEKELATEKVFQEVEWLTLFFFMGLFMLVGGLQEVGLIDEIARWIIHLTAGDMAVTSVMLLWVSGLASPIIDNIPFVAAMIPVIQEFQTYGMTYVDPLWWALALGACLGGNGTLIGASANVVVSGIAEAEDETISFVRFMKYGIPMVLVSLIVSSIYLYVRYLLPFMQGMPS